MEATESPLRTYELRFIGKGDVRPHRTFIADGDERALEIAARYIIERPDDAFVILETTVRTVAFYHPERSANKKGADG